MPDPPEVEEWPMFAIAEIPRLMGDHGWTRGKALMERWFRSPAAAAPNYVKPLTDLIKMDWILGFRRARRVFDDLVSGQIWGNDAARKEVVKMLAGKGFLQGYPGTQVFGDLDRAAPDLDADYINFRSVEGYQLDDLTAALGAFPIRVAVGGTVAPAIKDVGHDVMIQEIAVYVRDSYDFEGDQTLGWWHYDGRVGAFAFEGAEWVMNSDFRDYRAKHSRGGDFLVYSDVKRYTLSKPVTFNTWEYHERFKKTPASP